MRSFMGTYNHSLDQKNRLFIPAKFREQLGEEFIVVKAPKPDKCLFIYAKEDWELIELAIHNLQSGPQARMQNRLIHAVLDEVITDKQGRIMLKEDFCQYAGLEKDVMVLGAGKRIELWSKAEWDVMYETVDESLFTELPW